MLSQLPEIAIICYINTIKHHQLNLHCPHHRVKQMCDSSVEGKDVLVCLRMSHWCVLECRTMRIRTVVILSYYDSNYEVRPGIKASTHPPFSTVDTSTVACCFLFLFFTNEQLSTILYPGNLHFFLQKAQCIVRG